MQSFRKSGLHLDKVFEIWEKNKNKTSSGQNYNCSFKKEKIEYNRLESYPNNWILIMSDVIFLQTYKNLIGSKKCLHELDF